MTDEKRKKLGRWTGKAGRVVAAGAIAFAMGGGATLVNAAGAFADSTGSGSITINLPDQNDNGKTSNKTNHDVTFNAYKIFTGDVQKKDDDTSHDNVNAKIANIAWASDAYRTAVVGAIQATDSTYVDPTNASESAQLAAEFIASHINETTHPSTDTGYILKSGEFGNKLSAALQDIAADDTVTPGESKTLANGYWLFLTTPGTLGGKDATETTQQSQSGTSPIFAVVGGDPVEINEKATVPTVDKQVKDDSSTTYATAADANTGQELDYRLTGTLPSNLATYGTYTYNFHDQLTNLTYVDGSTKVTLHQGETETDVTDWFTVKGTKNVDFESADILAKAKAANVTLDPTTDYFTVDYKATLDADATYGGEGNENEAWIEYSNNPNRSTTGRSTSQETRTYAYELNIHKQDLQNAARSLAGAKFTLQVATGDDTGSNGKYVQENGSLGDTAYEFTTDDKGNIEVKGIDAGTYTLKETQAPDSIDGSHYSTIPDATIVIGSNVNTSLGTTETPQTGFAFDETDGSATRVSATNAPVFGQRGDIKLAASVDANGTVTGGVDSNTGIVSVVVRDSKHTQMPLTGGAGIAAFAIAGGIVIAAGAAMLAKRRRDEADQEA